MTEGSKSIVDTSMIELDHQFYEYGNLLQASSKGTYHINGDFVERLRKHQKLSCLF